MAGVSIVVRVKDTELRGALKAVRGFGAAATRLMGVALVKGTLRRFREARGPDGARWAALHPDYKAIKRGPGILRASGLLMKSVSYEATATEVRVGTNDIRARIHQFGGTIRPKKGQYLRFRMASGFVLARKVTIPARPFLGVDQDDEQELLDVLEAVILSRATGVRRAGR